MVTYGLRQIAHAASVWPEYKLKWLNGEVNRLTIRYGRSEAYRRIANRLKYSVSSIRNKYLSVSNHWGEYVPKYIRRENDEWGWLYHSNDWGWLRHF